MRNHLAMIALTGLAACGGAAADRGVTTAVDSTGDSLIVTVSGDIDSAQIHQLALEVRIAPGVDDTTLFTSVSEFDVDRRDRFWVFDGGSASIFIFGPDGALLRRIGRRGAGPGEFQQNGGMVVRPDDGLAQWDSRNARISFFDSSGTFVKSWPLSGGFSTSNGLISDASGDLFLRRPVTPPREGEILGRMGLVRLRDGGAFADSLEPPDIPVQRAVYVARVEGGASATSSSFAPNFHWGWSPRGEFVVANGGRYEIIVARKEGKPLVIRRRTSPVTIGPEERKYEERLILWQMRQTDPGWSWNGPPIPEAKAPIRSLSVSRDGRIWVQVAVPSEALSASEVPVYPDSTRPVPRFRTPSMYEVFAPDGTFLGRVRFPVRARLIEADGNTVWALDFDENDMPAVSRYRIDPGLH